MLFPKPTARATEDPQRHDPKRVEEEHGPT